ncbi:unnamed protein product, partial [Brenthis ino]
MPTPDKILMRKIKKRERKKLKLISQKTNGTQEDHTVTTEVEAVDAVSNEAKKRPIEAIETNNVSVPKKKKKKQKATTNTEPEVKEEPAESEKNEENNKVDNDDKNIDNSQCLGVVKPESPLPPGAEIIVDQLREVAQEVFADGDEDQNLVEDLTPFGIEDANTSFEASPPVVIEEFENIVASTPKSPLTIPTPMPSPTNSHKTCNDLFCALHDHWTDAVPSSPSTYSLPIASSLDPSASDVIAVCKTMFLNTLAVSERIVQTAFQKFDGVSDIYMDRRGRHANRKIVIDREMERSGSRPSVE